MGPAVNVPMLPEVEKRLVDDAVVEKRLVVVADVVVERSIVAPPTTSRLDKFGVEVNPMRTWFEVVETLIPEPLKKVQFTSVPPPPPV